MKLLRTIRLDPSDTFVFARAAEPGEWAVSGAFVFSGADPVALSAKERAAFRGGFLAVPSLGWSTLAQIVEAGADDCAATVELLARCLQAHFGAPDLAAARAAAAEEIDFAGSLCDHPPGTLVAVRRIYEDGAIRETFRTLHPRGGLRASGAFSFIETEGEEEPVEPVDLPALARGDFG